MQQHPSASTGAVFAPRRTKTWADGVPMRTRQPDLLAPRGAAKSMHAICGSGSSALGDKEYSMLCTGGLWHLPETSIAFVAEYGRPKGAARVRVEVIETTRRGGWESLCSVCLDMMPCFLVLVAPS